MNSVLNDIDQVRLVLDFGADPNFPDENDSPLRSPKIGKDSCILLLERGADPLKQVDGVAVMSRWFDEFEDEGT